MIKLKGFSLVEILVSLLVITGTSLALLSQQWRLSQALNQSLSELRHLIEIDNQNETNRK
ncbi:MAG: prepilin-type N-terminal cleavage/methylation domain-containing protein [Tatlockia sp.]|nr:prepilin-type N-terminal cleavage/methylation domain-containing protein [Tatlockia sp.]